MSHSTQRRHSAQILLAGFFLLTTLACQAVSGAVPTAALPPTAVALPSETLPPPTDTAIPLTDMVVPLTETAAPPSDTPSPIPPSPTAPPSYVVVRLFPSKGDLATQLATEAANARSMGLKPFVELEAMW